MGTPSRAASCERRWVKPIASASAASADGCFGQPEQDPNHERHLGLIRAAPSDGRLFDSLRRVFKNRQTSLRRRKNGRASSGPEQDRRLVTLHVNYRFECATIRFVRMNQFRQPVADRDQARGRAQRRRIMNDAEIKRLWLSAIGIDHSDAGIAQRSIDREDTHRINARAESPRRPFAAA